VPLLHSIEGFFGISAAAAEAEAAAEAAAAAGAGAAPAAAEGFGSAAGNARLRFERARGSLYEAQAGLRPAVAWGYVPAQACASVLGAIDRLGARVFGLSRR